MRLFAAVLAVFVVAYVSAEAGQPFNIRLDPNGVSVIYPVFDSSGWVLTQPDAGQVYANPGGGRVTHWADEYYAQDWARGCGATHGQRVYAGISGVVVWAGPRGPYGNTVTIYDPDSGFALKYSHLSEVSVSGGEYVLAGKSLVGRVGDTGNVQSSGCAEHPGAHLHLALFKNVTDPAARPVSSTLATSGGGPTVYAAPFGYAPPVELAMSPDNPSVYVLHYGTRVPVSANSFESHGWNFDKRQVLFSVMQGRTMNPADLSRIPKTNYLWPFRDHSLLKSSNNQTVYQFEDGRKNALSYSVFTCRGLRFGEVREVDLGERDGYAPIEDLPAAGCSGQLRQALNDWAKFARSNSAFQSPDLAGYFYYPDWDREWELRILPFAHSSGQSIILYRSSSIHNPDERYIGYWEPGTGQWSGWQRIY
jgi:murein DD-endopeptidase MepM/ murein hydrolase activator NlpD